MATGCLLALRRQRAFFRYHLKKNRDLSLGVWSPGTTLCSRERHGRDDRREHVPDRATLCAAPSRNLYPVDAQDYPGDHDRRGDRSIRFPDVLDYFWTAVTPGRARSHKQDGSIVEATYAAGETRHFAYGTGEYKIHDLENVGDTDLWFTTVEFGRSKRNDDLAELAAVLQIAVYFHHIVEFEYAIDDGLESAARKTLSGEPRRR
jgi:hypothetical protein